MRTAAGRDPVRIGRPILPAVPRRIGWAGPPADPGGGSMSWLKGFPVGSVIKKRRKRMAKKKHRKLLKKTRVQRRKLGK